MSSSQYVEETPHALRALVFILSAIIVIAVVTGPTRMDRYRSTVQAQAATAGSASAFAMR